MQFAPGSEVTALGHSRDDILVRLQGLLGPPPQPGKLDDYSDYHASHYQLPEAYIGTNPLIRETLNNLITNAPDNWQTSILLPWHQMDSLEIKWDEIQFNRSILPRTPYESASRMQTSIKRTHRDRVVRRGAAVMAESDFYRTKVGLNQFYNELMSIQQCVQITCNYDVIYNILTNSHYPRMYELNNNLINQRNLMSFFRRQIQTFAVLQKRDGKGLDIALELARRLMAEYNVTPDTLIVDPATMLYLRMVPVDKTAHYMAGDAGVAQYNQYNGSKGVIEYRGLKTYSQRVFDIGGNGDTTNMLKRNVQVGEHYTAQSPAVLKPKTPLPSTYMDRYLYNENMDMKRIVRFKDMVKYSCMTSEVGKTITKADLKMTGDHPNIAQSIRNLFYAADSTDSLLASLFNAIKIIPEAAKKTQGQVIEDIENFFKLQGNQPPDWDVIVALVELGVWVPVCIVLARPFIEHEMMSMIVTVAGADTGRTVFGHSDFQISANTNNKTIEGHYTFHSKAVVTKPQNIFVLEDVQCVGYVGGANNEFLGSKMNMSEDEDKPINQCIKYSIGNRLNGDDEDERSTYESILAFAAPFGGEILPHNLMVLGNGPVSFANGGASTSHVTTFPGGRKFAEFYDNLFGFTHNIYAGVDPGTVQDQSFVRNGTSHNAVCMIGPSMAFNPLIDAFELVPGQGHFGPDARAGDAQWRRGEAIDADQARKNTEGSNITAQYAYGA